MMQLLATFSCTTSILGLQQTLKKWTEIVTRIHSFSDLLGIIIIFILVIIIPVPSGMAEHINH
jgi:hypothetical protein